MGRTGLQRLDAIPAAIERGDAFEKRIPAAGTLTEYADLMAEAIQMAQEARGLETVGHDGRKTVTVEEIKAAHCMVATRVAYLQARSRLTNQ